MKHLLLPLFVACTIQISAQPLHLSQGETYSYEFVSLPFIRPPDRVPIIPAAGALCFFSGDLLDPGETVRVEIFENSLADPPVMTREFVGASLPVDQVLGGGTSRAWSDLRGAVRFTVVSGSVDLSMVRLFVWADFVSPHAPGFYQHDVVVPEPSIPPSIAVQPASQLAVVGQNATLHVTAAGPAPCLYQWRKDGLSLPGATASSYAILGVTTANAGNYDVVVSNLSGSITSAVATLTTVFPPSITVQPTSQVVASGGAATFSVNADGTDPLRYQWWSSAGPILEATNAVFTLSPALTNHGGTYYVVVSDRYATATSQVVSLTVFVPVTFTAQPAQQVAPLGGTAAFGVQANGYPAPQYQWLFNGDLLNGANGSTLVITNVGTNTLGDYSVVVWNPYSAATSSVAMLLMSPSIPSPFVGAMVIWGKSATLSASAVGSGDLTYQWYKDGAAIPLATGPQLVIPAVQLGDAGLYSLVVSSIWGSVTNAPAHLVVNPANISLATYAGITIEGAPGYTYGIQYITDLRDTNAWVGATNLTLTEPRQIWVDLESAGKPRRFYRVIAH